jgi:hypothetical protein
VVTPAGRLGLLSPPIPAAPEATDASGRFVPSPDAGLTIVGGLSPLPSSYDFIEGRETRTIAAGIRVPSSSNLSVLERYKPTISRICDERSFALYHGANHGPVATVHQTSPSLLWSRYLSMVNLLSISAL